MPSKPAPIYRPLLREALRLTWERKSLWVFGLFAGLVTSGGMLDAAGRDLSRVMGARELFEDALAGVVPFADTFSAWVRQVQLLEPARVTGTLTVAVLLALALVAAALLSQAALIRGLACKEDRPFHHTLREGRPFLWRLLALGLAGKAVRALLLACVALPLVLFVVRGGVADAWLYAVSFLVGFPLAVAANLVFTLASVDAVREDRGAAHAFVHALGRFAGAWLPALELGLLSFLAYGGIWLLTGAAVTLLSVPYAAGVALSLATGSTLGFMAVTGLFGVVAGAVTFAGTGAAVCFHHAVWVLFMDRTHPKRTPLVAKLERLWRKW